MQDTINLFVCVFLLLIAKQFFNCYRGSFHLPVRQFTGRPYGA